MSGLAQDLRFALRWLRKNPLWAVSAVGILGAAIGLATATFSLFHTTLFEPLPFREPGQLYQVELRQAPGAGGGVTPLDGYTLEAWRQGSSGTQGPVAYRIGSALLADAQPPSRSPAARVGGGLFGILGVPAAFGRTLGPEDVDRAVVVLSDRLWRTGYGKDPEIVGRAISLDGAPHEVVGVMPPDFFFPDQETLLWRSLRVDTSIDPSGQVLSFQYFPAIARVAAGEVEKTELEGEVILRRLIQSGRLMGDPEAVGRVRLVPLSTALVADVRPGLLAVTAAVGLLLLIACANLASMVLAKNSGRSQELAIRSALGGSHRRLIRQLATEALLLVVLGGAVGLAVALGLERIVPSLVPADLPRLGDLRVNWQGWGFALAMTTFAVFATSLLPSLRSLRGPSSKALRGLPTGTVRAHRRQALVVTGQVALATSLLVTAGLLLQSFLALSSVDLGFDPGGAVSLSLEPAPETGLRGSPSGFYDRVLEELAARPDVEAVGLVRHPPLGGGVSLVSVEIEDAAPDLRSLAVPQGFSEGYLEAAGIEILSGRAPTLEEHRGGSAVAVVNETFGRRFLNSGLFLGRRIRLEGRIYTVVGRVTDARLGGPDRDPVPEIYFPYRSVAQEPGPMTLWVRAPSGRPAESVLEAVRGTVRRLAPAMPLQGLLPLEERLAASVARPRFYAWFLSLLSLLALVLAAAGVYAVLAYTVSRQFQAFGIRQALGAEGKDLFRLVAVQGGRLVALGGLLGLALTWGVARGLESLLFAVTVRDLGTYLLGLAVVFVVAAAAIWFPARQAMRVPAAVALR